MAKRSTSTPEDGMPLHHVSVFLGHTAVGPDRDAPRREGELTASMATVVERRQRRRA